MVWLIKTILEVKRMTEKELKDKEKTMNPFKIFDTKEIERIERIENLENRDYTIEEFRTIETKILEDIMSNSSKNGDIDRARQEYKSIIDKCESYK